MTELPAVNLPSMKMSLDLTDEKSTLVQVSAWCCSGNKPLPEPIMTQFSVAICLPSLGPNE